MLDHGSFSLHIKGEAGTGKTTLALELVNLLSHKGETYYLSTRVSPSRLYEQFPWVKETMPPAKILDAKRETTRPQKLTPYSFEYTEQPDFLQALYSKIKEAKVFPVTIILDSLTALKANLNLAEDRLNVETVLLEICEKTNSNLILVAETGEPSRLDYLVGGVIRLERKIIDQRILRELIIEKIRGVKINNPCYLFTLSGGRFTCLEGKTETNMVFTQIPQPVTLTGNKIPTSIELMDRILGGGFEKGSLNILEINRNVGIKYL